MMRCSSEIYQIAGLKLYEHIEVGGLAIPKLLHGGGAELNSPVLPISTNDQNLLFPKHRSPTQRKLALLSLAQSLQITSLPRDMVAHLLPPLQYPGRQLFLRLESVSLGSKRSWTIRTAPGPDDLLRSIDIPQGFWPALRLLRPRQLCITQYGCHGVHAMVRGISNDEEQGDPVFPTHRLETCTIHLRRSRRMICRHRADLELPLVPVVAGVDMVYEVSGPVGHGMAEDETATFISDILLKPTSQYAKSYTFIDVAQTESVDLAEVLEKENSVIRLVKERIRARQGSAGLTYDELDERVRYYLRGDYGKHDCCAYMGEGLKREERDGRDYLKLSDVSDDSGDDE